MSDVEKLVVAEFQELVVENEAFSVPPTGPMSDRQTFEVAARLSHTLAYAFVRKFEDHIRRAELFDSLQSFVSLGPVALGIAPYLLSFANQHKDEAFLKEMARRFPAANGSLHRSDRKVWLTDTFSDVNGVAMTIRNLVAEARISRKPLNVVTCWATAARATARWSTSSPSASSPCRSTSIRRSPSHPSSTSSNTSSASASRR
jgi:hypothetical protein